MERPSNHEIDLRMQILAEQRNEFANQVVILKSQLQILQQKLNNVVPLKESESA